MNISLLEKARAGRIAALASLENRTEDQQTRRVLFDFDFARHSKKQPLQFTSHRSQAEEARLAA